MSLGLDALNKLQRERAERAAAVGAAAAVAMHPAAHTRPQTNRLLAAGFVVSLALATFALVRSRSNAVATPHPVDGQAAAPIPAPVPAAESGATSRGPLTLSVNLDASGSEAAGPRPNFLINNFLNSARVGGVDMRAGTGLGPVVMLNDAMCHLDDMVNPVLGIRLIGISPEKLTFRDPRGIAYEKSLTSQ